MTTLQDAPLVSVGVELDTAPEHFGLLRPSNDIATDGPALRARMEADGYLYLPGLLPREDVLGVRRHVLNGLAAEGLLHPDHPLDDGVLAPGTSLSFRPDLVQREPAVRELLFGGAMRAFARRFFDEPVRHFDYIWFRAMSHGMGSKPHCDIVYMGRGTPRLFTAWVPYGEVDLDLGGLMVLEGSHLQGDRLKSYLEMDVDIVCTNRPPTGKTNNWRTDGALSKNPRTLREKLGGRWLTAHYQPGDVIFFGMGLVHGSLDNRTGRVRLSSDTRYQRASEPADERWIGENPVGHGPGGKRNLIC